jgi:hypothetical protein
LPFFEEFLMTMRSWIRNLFDRPATRPIRKAPPRSRLGVELLENRTVPSTFTVLNTLDDGSVGSLRWAVGQANTSSGPDTIVFDPTVFSTPQTITLTGGLTLTDTATTTITGPAAGVTISGGGIFINSGDSAALSGMTITQGGLGNRGTATLTNCTVSGNSFFEAGGGLFNYGTASALTLINCTVSGNYARRGGGLYNHGGNVTLTNCTVSGNYADYGGGLENLFGNVTLTNCTVSGNSANDPHGSGGGLFNDGTATLTNCTVSGNSARSGGGLFNYYGTATLTNCTVSGNSAAGIGGGVKSFGGRATLTNCTVSGNSASSGGGLDIAYGTATLTDCTVSGNSAGAGGGLDNGGTATLTNCTVSGNSAVGDGGGLFNAGFTSVLTLTNCTVSGNSASSSGGGLLRLFGTVSTGNSIVAGNTATRSGPDAWGTVASRGNNLIGQTDGSSGWVSSDLTGTSALPLDPLLAHLGDFGGPTQTMALLPGSPALNAGDPNQLGVADQRGVLRSGGVNIGAFQASASAFVLTAPATVTAGTPFDVTVTAVDIFGQTAAGYTGTLTFTTTDPDPGVILPPDYTFTLADQGTHTFSGGFILMTPGTWTLTATDSAGGFSATAAVTVNSGPGGGQPANPPRLSDDFAIVDRIFAALPGELAWPGDVTVTVVDAYGNTVPTYLGTVHFSSTDPDPGVILPPDYTFQASDGGSHVFAAGVTLITPGDDTMTVTDTSSGLSGNGIIHVS